MQIYILRHGIAEDAKPGGRDADRELTAEGRKKLREVLRAARGAGVAPSLIVTSPLKRALQTAEIAAEILGYKEDVLRTKTLVPGAAPREVWEEIRIHKDIEQLMLVGHEPLLGSLTGYLLGSPLIEVDFKKGALARVDMRQFTAEPRGILKWLLVARLVAQ